eukprot:358288-Chlamydomonas_euryale.AAC.12
MLRRRKAALRAPRASRAGSEASRRCGRPATFAPWRSMDSFLGPAVGAGAPAHGRRAARRKSGSSSLLAQLLGDASELSAMVQVQASGWNGRRRVSGVGGDSYLLSEIARGAAPVPVQDQEGKGRIRHRLMAQCR